MTIFDFNSALFAVALKSKRGGDTLEVFAKKIKIHYVLLCDYENERRKPTLEKFLSICKYIGVDPRSFIIKINPSKLESNAN